MDISYHSELKWPAQSFDHFVGINLANYSWWAAHECALSVAPLACFIFSEPAQIP